MSALLTALRHPRAWWRLTRAIARQQRAETAPRCARRCGKRGTDAVLVMVDGVVWPKGTRLAMCQEHADEALSAGVVDLL